MANNKIGALWGPNSYGGYTGNIEVDGKKVDIILFANKNKKSEKAPDFDICVRKPKESQGTYEPPVVDDMDVPF